MATRIPRDKCAECGRALTYKTTAAGNGFRYVEKNGQRVKVHISCLGGAIANGAQFIQKDVQ